MNITDALNKLKQKKNLIATCGDYSISHFVGTTGAHPNRMYYDDYEVLFNGERINGDKLPFHILVSGEWNVRKIQIQDYVQNITSTWINDPDTFRIHPGDIVYCDNSFTTGSVSYKEWVLPPIPISSSAGNFKVSLTNNNNE